MSPSSAKRLRYCSCILLAAMPYRFTGTVLFKNYGRHAAVRFDLRRTPNGWRIDDLRAGSKPSLRTQMALCAASGN